MCACPPALGMCAIARQCPQNTSPQSSQHPTAQRRSHSSQSRCVGAPSDTLGGFRGTDQLKFLHTTRIASLLCRGELFYTIIGADTTYLHVIGCVTFDRVDNNTSEKLRLKQGTTRKRLLPSGLSCQWVQSRCATVRAMSIELRYALTLVSQLFWCPVYSTSGLKVCRFTIQSYSCLPFMLAHRLRT